MSIVTYGSKVTISYIGTLDNGRIFDETADQGPLTVTIGAGQLFPAMERAIIGMEAGSVKNIVLTADEAYGPHQRENLLRLSRDAFPLGKEIKTGQKISMEFANGTARVMVVTAVSESGVTLDGNHPLAGQELTFALKVERVE
ncbi:MAG: peptidylprolyl isomerase [Geobacter sp.]|nr:peptidylprolyl isomerase [Geobacter sp.]